MHELSIAHGIVDAVQDALRTAGRGPARVTRVVVRVGALSGVVPDSLHFCFDVATGGTALEGAALEVIPVPVAVYCDACDAIVELAEPNNFRCPRCGTLTPDLRRGKELDVEYFEIEDAEQEHA